MFFALDKNNNRTYIDNVKENEEYYCSICHSKMIIKNKGLIRHHHFAHPKCECLDKWTPDNSEWHIDWQMKFPKEYLEIVKIKDDKIHRADILIESTKTVVELQHSPISAREFNERNNFYNSLGYQVIWLFDLTRQYYNESIYDIGDFAYNWIRPKKTFSGFGYYEYPNVKLYFQFKIDIKNKEYLKHIIEATSINEVNFYNEHKNDVAMIVRVDWNNRPNFEWFIIAPHYFSEQDFIDEVLSGSFKEYKCPVVKREQQEVKINEDSLLRNEMNVINTEIKEVKYERTYDKEDLYNVLEFESEDEEKYIFTGCQLSIKHKCAIWKPNVKARDMLTLYNCNKCFFHGIKDGKFICRRKFQGLIKSMNEDDLIIDIKRDNRNRIIEVILLKDGKKVAYQYDYSY